MQLKFRNLNADEIEVRVSQVTEKYTQLLLYKTARTDMNLLDETAGAENWQCDYKLINNVLYAGIGIWNKDLAQWIWKWDCGSEKQIEVEKSTASDAFKRAGFKWGIGRELYTSPKIAILNDAIGGAVSKEYNGRTYWNLKNPWQTFYVKEIQYDKEGNIWRLSIINNKGVEIWSNIH